jgi:hypothetical protein
MHSDYKYNHVLTPTERLELLKMMRDEVYLKDICAKFGLSAQFLKCQFRNLKEVVPARLGSKTEAYYEDEMDYGLKNKRNLIN